jgi:hypothetical protein
MPLRWSRLREWNEANVALVHLQRGVSSRLMHWESVQCERSFSIQNVGLNFATGPNLTQTDAVSFGSFCSNARTGFHLRRTSPSGTGHPFQAALPVPQSSINGVRIGQTRTQRFRPLVAMDLVRGDGPLQRCSWQAHSERRGDALRANGARSTKKKRRAWALRQEASRSLTHGKTGACPGKPLRDNRGDNITQRFCSPATQ